MAEIKEILQKTAVRLGLGRPAGFVGSQDQTLAQLVEMVEQAGKFCFSSNVWAIGIKSVDITTLATEYQGEVATLIPELDYVNIDKGYYDQDLLDPVNVEIIGSGLYIKPAPSAGATLRLVYQAKAWLVTAAGVPVDTITSDDNVCLLDTELMVLASVAQWRLTKGLDATAAVAARNLRLTEKKMRDAVKKDLFLEGPSQEIIPGGTIHLYNTIRL